jgi:protein-disulfide isomerase
MCSFFPFTLPERLWYHASSGGNHWISAGVDDVLPDPKEHFMKLTSCIVAALLLTLSLAGPLPAEMDWQVLREIDVDAEVRDMAISIDGRWIYILTATNEIRIYSSGGKLKGAMPIDPGYNRIQPGPREDILLVANKNQQRVQLVSVNPIIAIDLSKAPIKGPADAPVTITVFSDFECAYCARLPKVLDQMAEAYAGDVRIAFKHYPLSSHKFAIPAALAAVAAQNQGKFWEFHDRLFEHFNELDEARISQIVKELNLDAARFDTDRKSPRAQQIVEADQREGYAAGVSGTPAMFINGKQQHRRSVDAIADAIDRELEAHRQANATTQQP